MTGGALAAPGGNGKGKGLALANGHAKQASSQGNGLALAKGHDKDAPATPQLTPPAGPAGVQAPAAAKLKTKKPVAPATTAKAGHLTICHATGSGRYIVISPSVTGVMRGHFKKHDDFVYEGSCARPAGGSAGSPPAEPPPATHPPRDPPSVDPGRPALRQSGNLPFTGLSAVYFAIAGALLLTAGLVLRRGGSLPEDDEGVDRSRA